MKCNKCGTEFDGKFCPECGTKGEDVVNSFEVNNEEKKKGIFNKKHKKTSPKTKEKKPFYKKWWVIAIITILVVFIGKNVFSSDKEKIKWGEIILADKLPEPPATKGEIYSNTDKRLSLSDLSVSIEEYSEYVEDCKDMGYTVEAETNDFSYEAFNKEGFKLEVDYHDYSDDETMSISLDAPIEIKDIQWPTSKAGNMLPTPKSNQGKFNYEYEDHFFVYIGNTTFDEYNSYIQSCIEKGFTVDYDKGDKYYRADNESGWHISVEYRGFKIMSVEIKAPEEDDSSTDVEEDISDKEDNDISNNQEVDDGGIDPDFKAAMDSYELFMDEYIEFMKKYSESDGTDLQLINDYISYLDKYSKAMEDFAKWEDEEMNDAELKYYIEVQTRVSNKLLEAGV